VYKTYQIHQLPSKIKPQTNTANVAPHNNEYRHLLRKIAKLLTTDEVEDLCFISTEANSSGIRNKTNFSGIVLFKFFEQRMLITAENLEYLRNHLKNIYRVDLCHLIDEYTNTYLSGTHRKPFAKPNPHVESHPLPNNVGPPLSTSVESRPPPFNPEYDQSKCIIM